ncbi:MAG: type II toxin-antitoxin system TacA family antitoxin [Acidiferrobacter sp.]
MTVGARFDLKLREDEKELFAQAAELMGTTTAGFVRAAAKEKARMLVEQEIRVTLSAQDFAKLAAALTKPFAPNKALKDALKSAGQITHRA